jgi:methyltransferase OMS1
MVRHHGTKKKNSMLRSAVIQLLSFTACRLNATAHAALVHSNPSPTRDNCAQMSRRSILTTILGSSSSLLVSSPKASSAKSSISSDDLRKIYDEGASTYESLYSDSIVSKTLDFPTLRANLLSNASGDVLELGVGTGLNLPHYPNLSSTTNPLSSYSALDISPKMMEQARQKFVDGVPSIAPSLNALHQQNKIDFRIGDVKNLSSLFEGRKFDTIIDTFGLCVFPEPMIALQQARASLKPTGKMLLLEHQDSLIGKALNPTRNIADVISTCRYDDDVLGLLRSAGFQNVSYQSFAGGFLLEVFAS